MDAPPDAVLESDHRVKNRRVKFPEFEGAMLSFFTLNDGKSVLTDDLLLKEARTLRSVNGIHEDDLKLFNVWLHKFKARHNIRQHMLYGEAASVGTADLVVSRMELKDFTCKYAPEDIFKFDESALFYRSPSNITLATVKQSGKKLVNDRVTVDFCCNMTGTEEIDLVVIGNSREPRAFRKVSIKTSTILRDKIVRCMQIGFASSTPGCTGDKYCIWSAKHRATRWLTSYTTSTSSSCYRT